MVDWKKLEAHPAADMFPRMILSDLLSLAYDIRDNGQLFPILLTDEETPRILDGRNRIEAYKKLAEEQCDLEPRIEVYRGSLSPIDYVRAVNWERMHLNPSQRAGIAVLIKKDKTVGAQLKAAAKARQLAGLNGEKGSNEERGRVDEHLGEQMGVSRSQVIKASAINEQSPEGFERFMNGESTVHAEYKKLSKKKDDPLAPEAGADEFVKQACKLMRNLDAELEKLHLDTRGLPRLAEGDHQRCLEAARDHQGRVSLFMRKLQELR